ncbi:MAG: MBL fold metallo-hydrolase [Solirubrobacteraceae bacterium]
MSPEDEAPGLAVAERSGIHRLAIATPFLVGRVNCYLIDDDPLTLVDTGPNSGKSLDELEQALAVHGRTVEELGLIVITHQHMDHLGLLEILQRRSGAEVAALAELAPYLEHFSASMAADDDYARELMALHGVPDDMAAVLSTVGAAFRAFGSGGHITRPLHSGDRLELRDRSFTVLHRPGHSASDTLFFDEQRGILLGGDHLLAHISSNAFVARPLSGETNGGRPHPLLDYIASMQATREMPASLVLTGHGDPIEDHARLIDDRLRLHSRRAAKLLGMLGDGPASAHDLAVRMWGNVAVTQTFLTLSEVLGHLDLLVRDGTVRERESADGVRFETV